MDKLNRLWLMADSMKVFVDFVPLREDNPDLWGIYISDLATLVDFRINKTCPAILLDKSLVANYRMQKCILAEELGHHMTAPRTDIRKIYTSFKKFSGNEEIKMAQDERKALLWATEFLMPTKNFCRLLSKDYLLYELADEFYVTEWMVWRKMEFLKIKEGLRCLF